jgi:hypothetical protein
MVTINKTIALILTTLLNLLGCSIADRVASIDR